LGDQDRDRFMDTVQDRLMGYGAGLHDSWINGAGLVHGCCAGMFRI